MAKHCVDCGHALKGATCMNCEVAALKGQLEEQAKTAKLAALEDREPDFKAVFTPGTVMYKTKASTAKAFITREIDTFHKVLPALPGEVLFHPLPHPPQQRHKTGHTWPECTCPSCRPQGRPEDPKEVKHKEAIHRDAEQMREQGPALATMAQLAALTDILSKLNAHEREVVMRGALRTAKRLLTGRTRYAPLDLSTDQRDWAKEIAEESSDAGAYSDMAAIQSENGWPVKQT